MSVNIEVQGRPETIDAAPLEKLKGLLQKLLSNTSASDCLLIILKRIHPDTNKDVEMTIQQAEGNGVCVLLTVPVENGEANGTQRFKCILSAPPIPHETFRKELVEAAESATGPKVRVIEKTAPRASSAPAVPKPGKGTKLEILDGLSNDPEKIRRVLQSIVKHASNGQFTTEEAITGFIEDFGKTSHRKSFGIVFSILKSKKLIVPLDDGKPRLYRLTPNAHAFLKGAQIALSADGAKLTPFMQQIADLENQAAEHTSVLEEIETRKAELATLEEKAKKLEPAIAKLESLKKALATTSGS